jgi:Fe-S cluster biogenesis protein NfuA
VELVDVKDGVVSVRLTGHCAGCPHSTMTLKKGIERFLKEKIPTVKEVVGV